LSRKLVLRCFVGEATLYSELSGAALAAEQQQQQQQHASSSSSVHSDAPHADVAADVTEWKLQVSTWNHLNKRLLPMLKPTGASKLEDVAYVLAELQRYAAHADSEGDSTRAQRLKLSLQEVVASRRARDTDKDVISKWIKLQRQHATEARGHLDLVSSNTL
jgi:hypothetical protein